MGGKLVEYKNFESMLKKTSQSAKQFPAFTLIEMLIVIVIIGLLAAMAVGSFGSARKRARLDIATDSMISTLKEQLGKAKSGRQSENDKSSCYGVFFQKTQKPYVQSVVIPYVSVPPVGDNSPYADYCDTQSVTVSPQLTPLEVADDVLLKDIQRNNQQVDSWIVLFKPPFGKILEAVSVDQIVPDLLSTNDGVKIVVNQEGNEATDARSFEFDAFSGEVHRVTATTSSQP